MEEWYDKEEDILNFELDSGEYWKSIELPNGVVIGLNKKGKVKAIEILRASKIFSCDAKRAIELA